MSNSTVVPINTSSDDFKLESLQQPTPAAPPSSPPAKAKWGGAMAKITQAKNVKKSIDLLVQEDTETAHHKHGHHHHSKYGKYMIHPNNKWKRAWDVVTILFVLYLCWKIPFSLGFAHWYGNKELKPYESFMDWWFGIDIIMTFATGFIHDGHLVMDPKATANHYFEFWFWVDMFASIPFEMFMANTSKASRKSVKMVKWFKIPRLLRIGRLLKQMKGYARFYKVFLAIALFLWMVHFLGCVWMSIVTPCEDDYTKYDSPTTCSYVWTHYATAVDAGVMALLGSQAQMYAGDEFATPTFENTAGIHTFHCLSSAFGLLLVAWIFGEASVILHNIDPSGWEFFGRLDRIKSEMTIHNVPADLQHDIRKFYDYIYLNNGHGQLSLLGDPDMSVSLRQKVALHLHQDVLLEQELFRNLSRQCLLFLCERMHLEIHMPEESIITAGDKSSDKMDLKMYIIKRGRLQVIDGKGKKAKNIATLTSGMAFGEMSMLCPGLPRTKTIKTETIVECYAISYNDFNQMLELFPGFSRDMRKLAIERGLTAKMLNALPAHPEDVSEESLDKLDSMSLEELEKKNIKVQQDMMKRLDRQLVSVTDMLRSLKRRT